MSLSSKEAADTLSEVEDAARRSIRAFGYDRAAPHLMLWGTIWLLGYFYLPEHFLLLVAFVGGGGMILAGIWFRRV